MEDEIVADGDQHVQSIEGSGLGAEVDADLLDLGRCREGRLEDLALGDALADDEDVAEKVAHVGLGGDAIAFSFFLSLTAYLLAILWAD